MDSRPRAALVGLIYPALTGEREHLLRPVEVTDTSDRRHRRRRFRGYCPVEHRPALVILVGEKDGL